MDIYFHSVLGLFSVQCLRTAVHTDTAQCMLGCQFTWWSAQEKYTYYLSVEGHHRSLHSPEYITSTMITVYIILLSHWIPINSIAKAVSIIHGILVINVSFLSWNSQSILDTWQYQGDYLVQEGSYTWFKMHPLDCYVTCKIHIVK